MKPPFEEQMDLSQVLALNGSCICCSGIHELRYFVNSIPERANGITLIEANGTSDACSLMGFLGVGLNERFLPPIQISVVDVKNWQNRKENNELEANQVQVSSMIVLTHSDTTTEDRQRRVVDELRKLNPMARIIPMSQVDITLLPKLDPSANNHQKLDHLKAHWSSCSIDLPKLPDYQSIQDLCNAFSQNILRIKGCTQIGAEENYTYFERTPDGELFTRPFKGIPTTGAKLLTIGPGSDLTILEEAISNALSKANSRVCP